MEVNQIICGDCLEVMEGIDNNFIDLTVTSPPYDNLRDYSGYSFDFKNIAKELYRVTKQGGVVVWVVGDATINGSETGTSFEQALYFKEIGFNLHDTMIYEKKSCAYPANGKSVRYSNIFEYMFVLTKGKPKAINLIKDKKNRWAGSMTFGRCSHRQKDGSLLKTERKKVLECGYRNNIWRINNGYGYSSKDNISYHHPAIFPDKLAQDHIISWSNKGDIVLDPMCGSGTTCKMAKKLGRKYIGIDTSKEYVEITRRRIRVIPGLLF